MGITYTPDFWTPQLLTDDELSKICNWLMACQKATVMAYSVMEEGEPGLPANLEECYKSDHPALGVAIAHVEALVRHIRATQEGRTQ
jgi:hypothetical protein